MTATLSRFRTRARKSKRVVHAFDEHGDIVFDEVDEEQGSNARPSDLGQLAFTRHLALSWGPR